MENEYKSYRLKKPINPFLKVFLIMIAMFYIFMLTSSGWMQESDGNYEETAINKMITNENVKRSLALIRWEYSESQEKMQIQLRIENNSLDGKNEYDFVAVDRNRGTLKAVSEIYQDNTIVVLDINNVPKNWSTISLRMALKGDNPNEKFIFRIYGNDKNIKSVDKIVDSGKNSYYILDIKASIDELKEKIKEQEAIIADDKQKIEEITKLISDKTDNLSYMTEQEMEEANGKINALRSSAESYRSEIIKCQDLNLEYQQRIEKLNEKIESYE